MVDVPRSTVVLYTTIYIYDVIHFIAISVCLKVFCHFPETSYTSAIFSTNIVDFYLLQHFIVLKNGKQTKTQKKKNDNIKSGKNRSVNGVLTTKVNKIRGIFHD